MAVSSLLFFPFRWLANRKDKTIYKCVEREFSLSLSASCLLQYSLIYIQSLYHLLPNVLLSSTLGTKIIHPPIFLQTSP